MQANPSIAQLKISVNSMIECSPSFELPPREKKKTLKEIEGRGQWYTVTTINVHLTRNEYFNRAIG